MGSTWVFSRKREVIKHDVMNFLRDFYDSRKLDSRLNSLFITLILKNHSPSNLGEYGPISLIESLYKILAKVLANRLREVLPQKISENQSAFMVIALEMVDSMHKNSGGVLFKIGFEKAFDNVDLNYMDYIMSRMGFGTKWRMWISGCFSSDSKNKHNQPK